VVEGCPVPVVIAGGKKLPEKDALKIAFDAISEGAVGIDMGRNIFQSANPVGMIKAVRAIVHEGKRVNEALRVFGEGQAVRQLAK
jgi:putative autoinducer-2 (AI-2) aldolase